MLSSPVFLILTSVAFRSSVGYKVLVVFPFPTGSHAFLGDGFVKHLLKAGHEVTHITTAPWKEAHHRLRQINVSDNYEVMPVLNMDHLMRKETSLSAGMVLEMGHTVAEHTLRQPGVQALLNDRAQHFDLVIAEWMFTELYSGLGAVFGCPYAWSSSIDSHWMTRRLMDGATSPAYTADYVSTNLPPFSFTQRVEELWMQVQTTAILWSMHSEVEKAYQELYAPAMEARGRALPQYQDVVYNASIMFLNSHASFGEPNSVPQNVKYIGGYHIDTPVKPLPEKLKKIMDSSKDGVIYFSMGSVIKSKDMSDALKAGLLRMFAKLKQTVLWKLEQTLPDTPHNVHILKWAPQTSILNHPKCVLFITHGGQLSTTEAIHAAVPIIGIPMFADQFNNMQRALARGIGRRLDLSPDAPTILYDNINEILKNSSYRDTVKQISKLYHDRTKLPGEELVYWVEHVVRTRGAPHLRSPALMVPWYQKIYLDLVASILVLIVAIHAIVKKLRQYANFDEHRISYTKKRN